MPRRLAFSIGSLLFAALAGGCSGKEQSGSAAEAGPERPGPPAQVQADATWPNVLLISVDTLRPDHLGCYGYHRRTSPRIDQLASEGALFVNTLSSTSWTLPAHACMFTGLADTVHGCYEMDRRLADDRVTLAERLKEVGYRTVGFFAGPALHPVFGVAQGFDQYIDCTSYADLSVATIDSGVSLDGSIVESASMRDITNPRVFERVNRWLDANVARPSDPAGPVERGPAAPFFMFVHLWDAHFDFIPPPPYDRMFDPDYQGTITGQNFVLDPAINRDLPQRDIDHIIALYDGEIAWTDLHVGQILDEFAARGLRDNTLVILVSDHGEEFFEHGHKGHRVTLFDEVIRVPLIIRLPGRVPAGQRYTAQARLMDLVPTIAELLGLPPPAVMGQSLVPLFRGARLKADDIALSELFSVGRQQRSYRRPDRKLIYDEKRRGGLAFDLLADPGEHSSLPQNHATTAQLLRDARRVMTWLTEFRKTLPDSFARPELPQNVRRQLQGLGYIESGHPETQPTQP